MTKLLIGLFISTVLIGLGLLIYSVGYDSEKNVYKTLISHPNVEDANGSYYDGDILDMEIRFVDGTTFTIARYPINGRSRYNMTIASFNGRRILCSKEALIKMIEDNYEGVMIPPVVGSNRPHQLISEIRKPSRDVYSIIESKSYNGLQCEISSM